MTHIAEMLHRSLTDNYKEAIGILKLISPRFNGFEYMFFPGYVELYGLNEYKESVAALEHFTENSSSELAVRPFIKKYKGEMMAQMEEWAESKNYHIRRLASEGCRPRLPWAMALPDFKKDPRPVLKVLEKLKDDESEFVRRSVANNLNDISKDNPHILIGIANRWLGRSTNTDRLIKHACRSLLKQGIPEVLLLFGFSDPGHISIEEFSLQESVKREERLDFSFTLKSEDRELGKVRIEYGLDFMKKNGRLSRKTFKISESDSLEQVKKVTRQHSFKSITTRKYYSGAHGLAIIVNGKELASGTFTLTEKS